MGEVIQFYGFGWEELLRMPVTWFCKFYNRMPVVEARRQLTSLRAHAFPQMDAQGQRATLRDLRNTAQAEQDKLVVLPNQATKKEVAAGWARLKRINQGGLTGGF